MFVKLFDFSKVWNITNSLWKILSCKKTKFHNELLSKETQRINKDISIIDTHDHFQYPINIRITRWKLVYSACKVQSWIYSSLNDFEVWDEAINPTFDVALLTYPIKLNI